MKRWIVIADWPEEGHFEHFETEDEAVSYVENKVFPAAEKESFDNEGQWPNWLDDTIIYHATHDIVHGTKGPMVRKLKD